MMQLKALAGLQAQREALDSRRHGQADNFYQDGLKAFARASNSGFKDRSALQAALENWVEAVKRQRSNPEPCIALGYLFMILGDSRTAVMYLKTAQRLAPQHPDPPTLLEQLINQKPVQTSAPAQTSETPDEDEVLELIQSWMLRIVSWPPPIAKAQSGYSAQLNQCRSQLGAGILALQAQLTALDAEMDVSLLRARLQPLERRQSDYTIALDLTLTFEKLAAELNSLDLTVKQALDSGMSASELDQILDRLDWIADRLDDYSNQGHDVESLETSYGQLCGRVESLQDQLDE